MASIEQIDENNTERLALVDAFNRSRQRTRDLFELLNPRVYFSRPIRLRNPIVFYEGHIPAFNVNTLLKRGLGKSGVHPQFEKLFERGIDPEDESGVNNSQQSWPSRDEVQAYAMAADEAVQSAFLNGPINCVDSRAPGLVQAAHTILEHEATHQETLLYIWHQVPYEDKRPPGEMQLKLGSDLQTVPPVRIPEGRATLGMASGKGTFGWDNEFPSLVVEVPEFSIDIYNVTNSDFLEFVEEGGYGNEIHWAPEAWRWRSEAQLNHPQFWRRRENQWYWRGMFQEVPLPLAWPVYVSHAEASAYAKWRGRRLPSEAEFHRAAYGTPFGTERPFPWGDEQPDVTRGNFDFQQWDPTPVGAYPAGQSAWGVHDLLGNGWEWTSTVFNGFPGFQPMFLYPEYSADFFDGHHYVIKGGSPATARELLRRSFRNWFRPHYSHVYATFRCAD